MKPTLEQVVAALKERQSKPFKAEEYLFDKQLELVNDTARFKTAVTTRRAGKTVSCAADLLSTALEEPFTVSLYITLSRTNAKKLVWRELKKINRQFGLSIEFNESELSATAPNGSIIYCSGASDKTEIEKFRGLALKKIYIDESQSFPAYLGDLIDEVLAPALMDHAGSLILIGTPGPVPTGYFYDCSQSKNWSHHYWTFWDNPHIKNAKQVFEDELKRKGVSANNPTIQREWFGRWLLDTDSLVYKYDDTKNHYNDLPEDKYTYLLGVDLGFNDADAIAVLAWSENSKVTYLVEEIVVRRQGISELVAQIDSLKSKYDISKIIVDQGGLGKKISEELNRRYKLATQPAEKSRKVEFIELLNDALRTGGIKARKDSLFAQDCMKVEWDVDKSTPDRKVISKRFHSDICEAVLYAWRESYSFTHVPVTPKPKIGSKEWSDAEALRMEEAAEEHFKDQAEFEKLYS